MDTERAHGHRSDNKRSIDAVSRSTSLEGDDGWDDSFSKKRMIKRACLQCRKSKVRCDGERPCGRCKQRGYEANCQEDPVSMPGLASNYLLSKLNNEDFNAESQDIRKIFEKWPYETFRRRCEESMDPASLLRILDSLPPALTAVMHSGFEAIERLSSHGLRNLKTLLPPSVVEPGASDFSHPVEEWENKMWEKLKDRGFIRTCFGPPTFTRRTDLYINQFAAKLAGLPREKVLERMWMRDGPMTMTELDTLCHLLDDMVQTLEVSSTRYLRWAETWHDLHTAVLVVQTTEKQLHFSGKIVQVKEVFRVVTADEFDAELSKNSAVRPFADALHDRRSAAQLLADFPRDRKRTISQMRQTEAGTQVLDRLAHEAHRRFLPLVAAANKLREAKGGGEVERRAEAERPSSVKPPPSPSSSGSASSALPKACASLVSGDWPPTPHLQQLLGGELVRVQPDPGPLSAPSPSLLQPPVSVAAVAVSLHAGSMHHAGLPLHGEASAGLDGAFHAGMELMGAAGTPASAGAAGPRLSGKLHSPLVLMAPPGGHVVFGQDRAVPTPPRDSMGGALNQPS